MSHGGRSHSLISHLAAEVAIRLSLSLSLRSPGRLDVLPFDVTEMQTVFFSLKLELLLFEFWILF